MLQYDHMRQIAVYPHAGEKQRKPDSCLELHQSRPKKDSTSAQLSIVSFTCLVDIPPAQRHMHFDCIDWNRAFFKTITISLQTAPVHPHTGGEAIRVTEGHVASRAQRWSGWETAVVSLQQDF
ncbi:hypothetical protein BGY98DRAFT_939247 [Russula aff. rugulosa BPL654]|nr:hypothetical protein BGY98DRAFT_939247 [Russula aff. rugulosa BPL654]